MPKDRVGHTARQISDGASRLLLGWDATDLLTFDDTQWEVIPWTRFHATMYHYEIAHDQQRETKVVTLQPAFDHSFKVYVSDKWGPFIQSLRDCMWTLTATGHRPVGVTYIALSGLPGIRRRWTIPLYTRDLFTPEV